MTALPPPALSKLKKSRHPTTTSEHTLKCGAKCVADSPDDNVYV